MRQIVYLGSNKDEALKKYHRLNLQIELNQPETVVSVEITVKELANRFITSQQANWRNSEETLKCYKQWLGRFIKDRPRLKVVEFSVEKFARWKLTLKKRQYSSESINHFLSAVHAMFVFAEETGIIEKSLRLRSIKNERIPIAGSREKPLYTLEDLHKLLNNADLMLKTMIIIALNCGFGPKDLQDLAWDDIEGERVTLPRSKTGICQTYLLWPESLELLNQIKRERALLILRMRKRKVDHSDDGHVFVTRYWKPWTNTNPTKKMRAMIKLYLRHPE